MGIWSTAGSIGGGILGTVISGGNPMVGYAIGSAIGGTLGGAADGSGGGGSQQGGMPSQMGAYQSQLMDQARSGYRYQKNRNINQESLEAARISGVGMNRGNWEQQNAMRFGGANSFGIGLRMASNEGEMRTGDEVRRNRAMLLEDQANRMFGYSQQQQGLLGMGLQNQQFNQELDWRRKQDRQDNLLGFLNSAMGTAGGMYATYKGYQSAQGRTTQQPPWWQGGQADTTRPAPAPPIGQPLYR